MNYQESITYLNDHAWRGSIYGIDTMRELARALGHPERRLNIIHIAGTNGKGSTVAGLSAVLLAAGYRITSYTSPEVDTYLDRFLVGGALPSEDAFARAMTEVAAAADAIEEEGKPHATVFEMELAVAWLLALEADVDLFIMETGLGGEMDATNVVEAPILTAITAIGLDHTQLLGPTLSDIAQAKAGIMKATAPVITWPALPEVDRVFAARAEALGIRRVALDPAQITEIALGKDGTRFVYQGTPYHMALIGEHQATNAAGIIALAHCLRENGYTLSDEAIAYGLAHCRWLGRFELCHEAPDILLDGAHNPNAVEALVRTLRHRYPNRRPILIMHVFKDKPLDGMLTPWQGLAQAFYCPDLHHPRSLPAADLAEKIAKDLPGLPVTVSGNLAEAIDAAKAAATPEDVIVIFGSLSHLAEARHLLRP